MRPERESGTSATDAFVGWVEEGLERRRDGILLSADVDLLGGDPRDAKFFHRARAFSLHDPLTPPIPSVVEA